MGLINSSEFLLRRSSYQFRSFNNFDSPALQSKPVLLVRL